MGCFSTPKREERTVPRYSTRSVGARDSNFSLLSNKPVELPDPRTLLGEPADQRRRTAFSGPLVYNNVSMADSSRAATANYFSSDDGKRHSGGMRMLRRASSFGGRPQPLPRPVDEGKQQEEKQQVLYLPLPAPEDASTGAPTTSSFKLEAARRGRAVAVGGLPLPPPSVASKLMPSLPAFEFRELMVATDDFAESSCLERGTFGAVFSARLKDPSCESTDLDDKMDATVLRLPENPAQGCLEWRSEVQLLAQMSSPNVCAVKGYCTHETGSRLSTRQERLLVFEQPYNGPLSDHLFGNRYLTYLDWRTRIEIGLSAARGLLYIHERAPVQIVYKDFCASNVLLDRDFASRLAGYGLSVTSTPSSSFKPSILLSQAHAKNNVWSFGIFLLELLTGKNSRDAIYLGDDENFVQWGRPYFKDEARLWQIIDPRMREQCPMTGAMEVVDLLLQCVSTKEPLRPPMAEVVESLQILKAKYSSSGLSRSKIKGPASWVLSPRRPTRLSRDFQSPSDLQSSSDASSSSENEDLFTTRLAATSESGCVVMRPGLR